MISSVTPALTANEQSTGLGDLGTDLFLELLVAQLQNQNPMEPMDGNALMQQTSQLANVEALQEVAALQSHLVGIDQFATAAGMVGKIVSATDPLLGTIEGVVTGVKATALGPTLQIGDRDIPLDQVTAIVANPATRSPQGDVS
jgi:flagellar basal-body rod modification protein FlgD